MSKIEELTNEEQCLLSDIQNGIVKYLNAYIEKREIIENIERKLQKKLSHEDYSNPSICVILQNSILMEKKRYLFERSGILDQATEAKNEEKDDYLNIINPYEMISFDNINYYRIICDCKDLSVRILRKLSEKGIHLYTTGNQKGNQDYIIYFKKDLCRRSKCPFSIRSLSIALSNIQEKILYKEGILSKELSEALKLLKSFLIDDSDDDNDEDYYEDFFEDEDEDD